MSYMHEQEDMCMLPLCQMEKHMIPEKTPEDAFSYKL